jgi:hypothetical protein
MNGDSVIVTVAEAEGIFGVDRDSILCSPYVQLLTRRLRDEPAEECMLVPAFWLREGRLGDSKFER